ncbi:MAG: hypothetical protein JNM62_05100 [Flavobacteriales bacterium]|nr:hypothetical protein [Flavobacteriales bacterium]
MERRRLIWTLTYLACILTLIWPALYNGYPILYSDSASYVASGMRLETPADRPITYGLFIRVTSIGGFTLWTTIACQAAMVVRVLQLLLLRMRPGKALHPLSLLAVVLALGVLTGLPWIVSQVMADIFTPLMVLSAVLLFLPSRMNIPRYQRNLLYLLFFFCVAVHLSHPVQVAVLMGGLVVLRWLLNRWCDMSIPLLPVGIMSALAVLAYPIMMSAVAKSGNIMFMGAMAEHGVAKAYLDEKCATEAFKLCAWKDRFPERAFQFHWDEKGPIGDYASRSEANTAFGPIVRGTLTEPKFIALQATASWKAMLKQLGMYAIGDGWGPFREGSDVYYVLTRHMRHDLWAITSSRQYLERMDVIPDFIHLHSWVVRGSLLALIPLVLLTYRSRRMDVLALIVICLAGLVLNAWGSGTFSGEVDRFGCKMIWMLPMLVVLATTALVRSEEAA